MQLVTREEWGAAHGRGYETSGAKTLVVVHHDGPHPSRSQPGMSLVQEFKIARAIEHYHANGLTKANPRIAYTAIGMQTGRVFEGCGWGRVGAHTGGMNSSSYGYFFPLAGDRDAPTPEAIASFREWCGEGVSLGHLAPNFIVKGHQDFNKPACPGKLVYEDAVLGFREPTAPPTVSEAIRARPTLRLGKGGIYAPAIEREAVRELQRRLLMPAPVRTGYFGTTTLRYVKEFQRQMGLKVDGLVGPKTWKALGV